MMPIILVSLLSMLALVGCGMSDEEEQSAPPPVAPGTSDDVFALAGGSYYITTLRDVQDGCGKNPNDADDPITQVPFVLSNDGTSNVTIDFCSFDGRSVTGAVRGNSGTLSVVHAARKVGGGSRPAEFAQDCRIDLTVPSDNRFEGRYVETQRNRNDVMRQATVDLAECTTSFSFVMEKQD